MAEIDQAPRTKHEPMNSSLQRVVLGAILLALLGCGASRMGAAESAAPLPRAQVGVYYFDGWAGTQPLKGQALWATNAPTHLTQRMVEEFPDREPIWGWRDDQLAIMEQQIDLAVDHGIAFFVFCWYWHPTKPAVEQDPKHTGLALFLRAKNHHRLKFCLLVANHQGFLIGEAANWNIAADYWMPYFTHPQHVTVDGKPLVVLFNPDDANAAGLTQLQTAAKKARLPGLAIAACRGGSAGTGFTHQTHYNITLGYTGGSQEHRYTELVEAHQKAWSGGKELPFIPEVTAGWDKRPWEGERGLNQKPGWYFPDRTPELFGQFLQSGVDWMDQYPAQTTKERLLLIYAWNEFGEGGYIAPTRGDPQGRYLEALKAVLFPKR